MFTRCVHNGPALVLTRHNIFSRKLFTLRLIGQTAVGSAQKEYAKAGMFGLLGPLQAHQQPEAKSHLSFHFGKEDIIISFGAPSLGVDAPPPRKARG